MRESEVGVSPDLVGRLIEILAEERKTFTSVEIAETLWLAIHIEPAAAVIPDESALALSSPPVASFLSSPPEAPQALPSLPKTAPPKVNIAAPTPQAGILPPHVLPVWLADPAMLTDSLAIVRALKPLLQKVASGVGKRLDEPATVNNIARTRLCLPILKLEQEPWFDIVLVVDRGSSMHIWQRLVKDVVQILRRYGAFRDVQVFDLVVSQTVRSTDHLKSGDAVRLISKPQHSGHRPGELIDQQGRRLAILLSDCAGAYWWNGTLLPMLQGWGKIMPTVVWQMLPPWMWKRTALGRGTAIAISNDIPGAANYRLKAQVQQREELGDSDRRIPLPVVTGEVRDLARWSLMVAGNRREVVPGFFLPQHGGSVPRSKGTEEIARDRALQTPDFDAAFNQELDTIAHERVSRFLELSSLQAQRLIMLLAAAPVITLPVVRLIRDAMLYTVQSPLPVAEVFLSGLLIRLPGQEDHELERLQQQENERPQLVLERPAVMQSEEDEPEPIQLEQQDFVQYDFAPKVRQILLRALPAVDTIEVLNSVSGAVERRWNQFSNQDFRAFLMNPAIAPPEGLAGLRSFASVTAEILEQLGGDYALLAQQLRQGSAIPPMPEPDDVIFPDLESFEFTDVQLIDNTEVDSTLPPDLNKAEFDQKLNAFEFTVATIQSSATWQLQLKKIQKASKWMIHRQRKHSFRVFELLAEADSLEMVAILGGTFVMGSPNNEPTHTVNESPQHKVTVAPFLISKFPITQEQWRIIAALPQIGQYLDINPSHFKEDKRPVEQVSWYDATEFCDRLSVHTGRQYRLPTEAEWEYACRAGTTTPFHFGETITTDLANYRGIDDPDKNWSGSYNQGPKGENRGETTPVDYFNIANAFGLSDMHGNVWEWCQDHWHDNYVGAPTDGGAWLTENEQPDRVRRGGCWVASPKNIRSAYRSHRPSDEKIHCMGFRVVCSEMHQR